MGSEEGRRVTFRAGRKGRGSAGKPFGGGEFGKARCGGHANGRAEYAEGEFEEPFGVEERGHMAFGQQGGQRGRAEERQLRHGRAEDTRRDAAQDGTDPFRGNPPP